MTQKRTFLLIEGQGGPYPHLIKDSFAKADIDIDYQQAWDIDGALDIIRGWQQEGKKLDIVTCDIKAALDDRGIKIMEALLDEIQSEIGPDMMPGKFFFHSADWRSEPVSTKYGTTELLDDSEFFRLQRDHSTYHEKWSRYRTLTNYLNKNWGTKFVMSQAEEKLLNNPHGLKNRMTKTILIIDGQSYCFRTGPMKESFAAAGIDTDIKTAPDIRFALHIIQEWKEQGKKLDIVTCDINATHDDYGIRAMETLLEDIQQEIGPDMMPEKFFFHSAKWRSKPVQTKYGSTELLDDDELSRIEDEHTICPDDWSLTTHRTLTDYLNKHWGTKFVMSKAEERLANNPDASLSPDDVGTLLYNRAIDPADALKRIRLDSANPFMDGQWIDKPSRNSDEEPCEMRFSGGAPGTVAGYIAYNTADIERLKAEDPKQAVILVLDSAEGFEIPPAGVEGVVVIKDDVHAAHIRNVCDNLGIPALIGAESDDTWHDFSMTTDGLSFSQYKGRKQTGFLPVGAGLTMEAYSSGGRLINGAWPIGSSDLNISRNFQEIVDLAAETLKNAHLPVKANADTAESVAKAVEFGADGIGLARTEHMFFAPEKKALLKDYLLSDNPTPDLKAAFKKAQEDELTGILTAANIDDRPFPVTVRLLDAPPAEFMNPAEVRQFESRVGKDNTRGVQAGLRTDGLYELQIESLVDAVRTTSFKNPVTLLVPNVRDEGEMDQVRGLFNTHAAETGIALAPMVESKAYADYLAGVDEMPYPSASYGTNDLTSDLMGGIARNDSPAIIAFMQANKIEGRPPSLALMTSVKDTIMSIQSRPDAPQATICGQQVALDEHSIRWAAREGLGMSVPFKYVPYVKLVAGQEIAFGKLKI